MCSVLSLQSLVDINYPPGALHPGPHSKDFKATILAAAHEMMDNEAHISQVAFTFEVPLSL